MPSKVYSVWRVRAVTFLLAALAAGSAVYWTLQGWGRSPGIAPALSAVASEAPPDPRAVARALGGGGVSAAAPGAPVVAASRRFVLQGVVADRRGVGAALISVDGQPAQPFRVGAVIDGGLVLQSVQGRRAVLAASLTGPAEITLELPAPTP